MTEAHRPQVGDWVVTVDRYRITARLVVAVKPKTLEVQSDWGDRTDRVPIGDVKAFSPDKAAIDLLVERLKSAEAERNDRVARANAALSKTRQNLFSNFAKARGEA